MKISRLDLTISDRVARVLVPYHHDDPFDIVFERLLSTAKPVRARFRLGL